MRIQSNSTIAGQPALKIRGLLRKIRDYQLGAPLTGIAELVDLDPLTTQKVLQTLSAEGYLEPVNYRNEERWRTTIQGNALASATARKPITRRTAERLLREFLARVEEVNACNDYAYRVKQVAVFGSYLSEIPTLGDIDLFVTLEHRYKDSRKQNDLIEKRTHYAFDKGKGSMEAILWPHIEVLHILKGRSPSISLHDPQHEQEIFQSTLSKILFESDAEVSQ